MSPALRRLGALRPRRVGLSASLFVAVAAYLFMAPAACGGPITYARVAGSSMEPSLNPGDLVVARTADAYGMGDIVAYHNPELGLVMHRIIVDNGDRVIVKGDANSWVDSYQPRKTDIAGRLWVRVPHGAALLTWLRPPWATLVFTALAVLVFVLPMAHRRPRAPRVEPARLRALWAQRVSPALTAYAPLGSVLAITSVVVGATAVLLTALAYGREPFRVTPEEHSYTQRLQFRYHAVAPPGLYDDPSIREGDPVFLRLTRAVRMGAEFDVDGDRLERPEGTLRLTATVRQQNGWERTMLIAPERPFAGTRAEAWGDLDLSAFRRMIDDAEAASGVHFESYQLVVRADVSTRLGDGEALRPFAPQLVFRISATQLQIEQTPSGERSPLVHAIGGVLRTTHVEPNHLTLGPWSPQVGSVRFWAPVVLVGAVAVLAILVHATLAALGTSEADRIEAQYGALVMRAQMLQPPPGQTLVRMQSFEDLARIARASNLPILRRSDSPPDYMLLTPEAAYHYEASDHERPSAITARIAERVRRQAA